MDETFALSLPDTFQAMLVELKEATQPRQAKKIESTSAAGQAWARENDDYVSYLNATYLYIQARRRFTELVKPFIQHGGHNRKKKQGDIDATLLEDFRLNKFEWHRRVRELEIPPEVIEAYFFEVSESRWNPSVAGLMAYYRKGGELPHRQYDPTPITCPNCGHMLGSG